MSDARIRVLVIGESPIIRAGLAAAISESERVGFHQDHGRGTDLIDRPPATPLTPRELEVLRLLADGASNKMIAHKLGISEHTVKFHVTSILSKLNAGTRTEAVTLGIRQGLVYL